MALIYKDMQEFKITEEDINAKNSLAIAK